MHDNALLFLLGIVDFQAIETAQIALLWVLAARHEHPELQLPSPPIHQMVRCMDMILTSPTNPVSSFDKEVVSALRVIFGNGIRLRKNALSISGWTMDIELLLDNEGKVIVPPESTVDHTTDMYLHLARVAYLSCQNGVHPQKMKLGGDPLLSSLPSNLVCCRQLLDESLPVVRRIAIEADGPHHYMRNNNRHPRGKTVLKKRQLETVGWEVIQVGGHHL